MSEAQQNTSPGPENATTDGAVLMIEFKGSRKEYYRNPYDLKLKRGDWIIVQVERGEDLGQFITEVDPDKIGKDSIKPLPILRAAVESEIAVREQNSNKEKDAKVECLKLIAKRGLKMKLVDVEWQFDGNKITFYGGSTISNLEKLIFLQMEREYFPITLHELSSDINFTTLEDNPFMINDVKIYYTHLIHPTLSIGFRIEYKDKVFVYATDNEISSDPEIERINEKNIASLIKNADMLVADCQYTPEEYTDKIGWGHTSIDKIIEIANKYNVKNLFTFHHDPLRTDNEIDQMIKDARKIAKQPLKVFGSKEKMTIYL